MDKEKIGDFVDAWAKTIGLKENRYITLIKSDILKRCNMYRDVTSTMSIDKDYNESYLIKPQNGEYSLEDFFLNRLMLGMRVAEFSDALEGNAGEYVAQDKTFCVDVNLINRKVNEKAQRHPGLAGKNIQIIKKTIEHELGHCFKSSFTDGYKAVPGMGREQDEIYEKLINELRTIKDGKYADQIKTIQELNHGVSSSIKTGVHDAKTNYKNDSRIQYIDELLNESEALELTASNDVHERWALQTNEGCNSSTGNYVNVYNYLSAYSTFTGYGPILKSLLGKGNVFYGEYISSAEMFKQFDKEYANIVPEVWGQELKGIEPTKCIFIDFEDLVLRKMMNEEIMLKLDEFFAKCYRQKVDKMRLANGGELTTEQQEVIKTEITEFQARLTTNNDPQKKASLEHNIVFQDILDRLQDKAIVKQVQIIPRSKQNFINDLINSYDSTEKDFQREVRVNNRKVDIDRVKRIVDLYDAGTNENGIVDRTQLTDLQGKWKGIPGEQGFKIVYSIKEVSSLVRLFKAAQELSNNSSLNPEGKDYFSVFASIPDINEMLLSLKKDAINDKDSYAFELLGKVLEKKKTQNDIKLNNVQKKVAGVRMPEIDEQAKSLISIRETELEKDPLNPNMDSQEGR